MIFFKLSRRLTFITIFACSWIWKETQGTLEKILEWSEPIWCIKLWIWLFHRRTFFLFHHRSKISNNQCNIRSDFVLYNFENRCHPSYLQFAIYNEWQNFLLLMIQARCSLPLMENKIAFYGCLLYPQTIPQCHFAVRVNNWKVSWEKI